MAENEPLPTEELLKKLTSGEIFDHIVDETPEGKQIADFVRNLYPGSDFDTTPEMVLSDPEVQQAIEESIIPDGI